MAEQMTVGRLITELSKYPDNTPVVVWEGYNAGCVSGEFGITPGTRNDGELFLILED